MIWLEPPPNNSDHKYHHNHHECFVGNTFYFQLLTVTNAGDNQLEIIKQHQDEQIMGI